MKMTVGKITFTALLTFISLWAETLAVPILVLAVLMFCDWLTGVVNASMHNELSSRIGMKGIIK